MLLRCLQGEQAHGRQGQPTGSKTAFSKPLAALFELQPAALTFSRRFETWSSVRLSLSFSDAPRSSPALFPTHLPMLLPSSSSSLLLRHLRVCSPVDCKR